MTEMHMRTNDSGLVTREMRKGRTATAMTMESEIGTGSEAEMSPRKMLGESSETRYEINTVSPPTVDTTPRRMRTAKVHESYTEYAAWRTTKRT